MRFTKILILGAALVTSTAARPAPQPATAPLTITVYHSPTCGCCKKWVEYLKADGFTVKSIEQADLTDIKAELGVAPKLRSCHTAVIAGYVIEGHVPAADIKRLLNEKPRITGLTAPGMPQSAPGMDMGKEPFEVLAFDGKGATTVWAMH